MSTNTGWAPRSATAAARDGKREARHDDLVAGLEADRERRELQRRRARTA